MMMSNDITSRDTFGNEMLVLTSHNKLEILSILFTVKSHIAHACSPRRQRQLDLPYNQEYNDCQHQIVCLIVQQVADHSVVPFRQISRVWFGEAL